jgi:cobalt/nickel transport system ATP-binding protein
MSEIFSLNKINFCYQPNQFALKDITLSIYEGEILSIIGSNGSGKSTLLNILCGLIFPVSGIIKYKGNVINEKSFKDKQFNIKFRSTIGYVFQDADDQLFCPTVFDELIFGPLQLGLKHEEAYERADLIMKMLRIEYIKERPVYMLSGGEKKKVAIGAVLTMNPDIIIFDEPLSGLDPRTRSFIIELIFDLNKAKKTIIITTHHLELADHLQSRIIVLGEDHTIIKTGTSNEILSDTDLLIKTNLISEYPHKHENIIHKHFSDNFLFFRHKH